MAIIVNQSNSKLKLFFNAGTDENDKDIIKNKTYSNIKAAVTNDDVYNLGVELSQLQEYPLVNLVRLEEYQLLNDIED
ncbi:DUF1659 domain-containing protein [Sedimentibacter hydroxybenzoicus DSM 7310]|uniref:DUF1659 domain-containing protein n=1 Tax=Sedimentibacter hydroxybenzoicus DSM 7310 TaxID=1123245 RepID=A0A974BKK4_SEDHY|nr:DUF1659 domain-containing protein [Sedimentibacter hydroxybenzoicus]NYB74462.1 DUF1659 domain-containing protein [Sedimentibacter hydroxybenzoicus DSM 7310]